ncbi:synaptotagmin-3-like [Thrips palmi]|uniref:Synaptotagmin-3-like n=1 Tax=Thrips palmi TaxID=161013 RepID=A0A6P8Y3A8_THRPL|nr:synaptotagmin-3-like [Thrips palmi]
MGVAVRVNSLLDDGRTALQGLLASLPPWARGAALAGGCLALVVGLLILAWLLKPGCLSRICCRRRRRNSENVTPPLDKPKKHSIDEELQLEDVTYRSWARGSLYDTPLAGDGDSVSHASHRDSTYSSMSDATDTSSILSYASGVLPSNDSSAACLASTPSGPLGGALGGALGGPPSVVLLVQYLGHGEEGAASPTGRLALTVVEARCLPSRDYGASPDPSVQLSVSPRRLPFPFRWLRGRGHPLGLGLGLGRPRTLHQLRTRSVRHSRQPRFNEDFAVEARRADIKDWSLQVAVMDECKLRGSTLLCRGEVRLKQILAAREPTQLCVPLAPQPEERALLLFGLSFLPTAQRLSVSVVKATRVRLEHVVPSPDHFRPYVRATLVHSGSGRRVDSARTSPQEPSLNPEFCETLSLKLTPAQLGSLSLIVALCHRLSDGDERGPGGRHPRDRVLGAVAVGSRVQGERGREHWRAIEQRPRRVVSIWHTLT